MNDHSLPDDLSRWPANAYELLGVSHGVDPKEMKRSYTRLIRVFKPETHPEHFRRIREAYEQVLRNLEFFGAHFLFTPPVEQSPVVTKPLIEEPKAEEPREENADKNETYTSESTSNGTPPKPAYVYELDEAAKLWERAIQGEEVEAYQGLRWLQEFEPSRSEHCLRLYWLLSLNPELDAGRHPREWLTRALHVNGLRGPALELYRREVDADPSEAVHARFEALLESEVSPSALADLYAWRWLALRRLDAWDVLARDFPIAKKRLFGIDEMHWLRLLGIAADAAAWYRWEEPYDLWQAIVAESKQLSHLGTRHAYWFDRFDLLIFIRGAWHAAWQEAKVRRRSPAAILDLIRCGWNAEWHTYRATFEKVLEGIVDDPARSLDRLDQLAATSPALLQRLWRDPTAS